MKPTVHAITHFIKESIGVFWGPTAIYYEKTVLSVNLLKHFNLSFFFLIYFHM